MEIILIICMLLGTFIYKYKMQHLQTAWNSLIKYTASAEYIQISKYMYEVTLLPMMSVALGTVRLQYCSAGALGETDQCITVKAQNKYPTKVSEVLIF